MNGRFGERARLSRRAWVVVFGLAVFLAEAVIGQDCALAATLISADQAAQAVSVRNVNADVKDGTVTGELVNNSSRLIRDVQLLIRYTWLWKNEMHPGQDESSDAVYYTVEGEIPAGGTRPFTYKRPTPLPARPDGHYEITVSVAGFAEVIPQK